MCEGCKVKQKDCIPKDEILWETYTEGDNIYKITSDRIRSVYFMYKKENNTFKKLGKASSPPELYKKFVNK